MECRESYTGRKRSVEGRDGGDAAQRTRGVVAVDGGRLSAWHRPAGAAGGAGRRDVAPAGAGACRGGGWGGRRGRCPARPSAPCGRCLVRLVRGLAGLGGHRLAGAATARGPAGPPPGDADALGDRRGDGPAAVAHGQRALRSAGRSGGAGRPGRCAAASQPGLVSRCRIGGLHGGDHAAGRSALASAGAPEAAGRAGESPRLRRGAGAVRAGRGGGRDGADTCRTGGGTAGRHRPRLGGPAAPGSARPPAPAAGGHTRRRSAGRAQRRRPGGDRARGLGRLPQHGRGASGVDQRPACHLAGLAGRGRDRAVLAPACGLAAAAARTGGGPLGRAGGCPHSAPC